MPQKNFSEPTNVDYDVYQLILHLMTMDYKGFARYTMSSKPLHFIYFPMISELLENHENHLNE